MDSPRIFRGWADHTARRTGATELRQAVRRFHGPEIGPAEKTRSLTKGDGCWSRIVVDGRGSEGQWVAGGREREERRGSERAESWGKQLRAGKATDGLVRRSSRPFIGLRQCQWLHHFARGLLLCSQRSSDGYTIDYLIPDRPIARPSFAEAPWLHS